MGTKPYMIVAKGKPISKDISSCVFNQKTHMWDVVFKGTKVYTYNQKNLTYLNNPTRLNPKYYEIKRQNWHFYNISSILTFHDGQNEYWRLNMANDEEYEYPRKELTVRESVFKHPKAKEVFDYLAEVAESVSLRSDENVAILSEQYKRIDFLGQDTAAAVYLYPDNYKFETFLDTSALIFPFGCNESQLEAVQNAISNRISIIEGPPGTGKTQTILNIIANLVVQNKTVQVVSNNNSAIENILEKIASPKYGVDFIVALLGRNTQKQDFIDAQSGKYPDLSAWANTASDTQAFRADIQKRSTQLQEIFRNKNRLAKLKKERYDIQLEQTYYQNTTANSSVKLFRGNISSKRLMTFWQEYLDIRENIKNEGALYYIKYWIYCLKWYFIHDINLFSLIGKNPVIILNHLQTLYYRKRLEEINSEISDLENKLRGIYADSLISEFTKMSLQYFRMKIAEKYAFEKDRKTFSADSLWRYPDAFLAEYPVILSTTYTSRSSLGKNAHFDYVIMDEASQIDVATGLLSLSSAKNTVIVGDTKQLPNIVTTKQKGELLNIFNKHNVDYSYEFTTHSFLKSFSELMGNQIPRTTLLEHYRCHPLIIEFCNQKFYNDSLVIMTERNKKNALQLVTTVAGNHRRSYDRQRENQRQVDIIQKEILPNLHYAENQIGIIAPYRAQVKLLKETLQRPNIEISTVHKFQGREKETIILSTVDDIVTDFSDDPNLLNVAVSRAKEKLIIVTSGQAQPPGSNIGDLEDYIRYNNGEIQQSGIRSVFDYLYSAYTEERMAYLKKYKPVSMYDSENLMYRLIRDELNRRNDTSLYVINHVPLNTLFQNTEQLNEREKKFVTGGLSHLDFLIYNKISKKPILAIEVDGFLYHRKGTAQAERDTVKNNILGKYHLPLLRFKTNGSEEAKQLSETLDELTHPFSQFSPPVRAM